MKVLFFFKIMLNLGFMCPVLSKSNFNNDDGDGEVGYNNDKKSIKIILQLQLCRCV